MVSQGLRCWSCGGSLEAVLLPFGRAESCPACEVWLHCCRQCVHYAPGASKDCREPMVEEVHEKEAGNFCDYFKPRAGLSAAGDPAAAAARARLASLFGGAAPPAPKSPAPQSPAQAPPPASGAADSEAEAARRKLAALFGKPKP
jgi:hypothetical protein